MSNKVNLVLRQGEDFYRLVTMRDENSALIDLTGFSFAGQIRATYSSDVFLSFSFNIKNQITNTGEFEITLAKELSSAKTIKGPVSFLFDIEMNSGSVVTRIMQGNIVIDPEVTR